jgi:hypothetical protein
MKRSDGYATALTHSHQLDTLRSRGLLRGIGHGVVFLTLLVILGSVLLNDANLGFCGDGVAPAQHEGQARYESR